MPFYLGTQAGSVGSRRQSVSQFAAISNTIFQLLVFCACFSKICFSNLL